MQNQGAPPYTPDPPGRIELNLELNPLQFFLYAVTPRVWVNGHALAAKWGRQSFDMPAGMHDVFCAFPYIFKDQCCPARMSVPVHAGYVTVLSYQTPMMMFSAGNLRLMATLPMTTNTMR